LAIVGYGERIIDTGNFKSTGFPAKNRGANNLGLTICLGWRDGSVMQNG